ncbi:MAG TPA: hypothetical protein PLL32_05530 [Anaeromyxobacteraceae bacterium]|nr:hypothetical protein [Anaeromyxobacteraceae bacterium]
MNAAPFTGGRTLMTRAAVVGVVGLAATAAGAAMDPRRALYAYLAAFVYWSGIAAAAMVFLMANEAANAKWYIVVRRLLEALPTAFTVLAVLFLPIALFAGRIFPWVDPTAATHAALQPWAHGEGKLAIHLWEHRHPWMNLPFFLVRAAVYFLVWLGVAAAMRRWSLAQDASGAPELKLKMRRLGAGGLPFVALAITFAAFDWQMSLSAFLFSTIFGVYWFAGSLVAAIGMLILAAAAASREEPLKSAINPNHIHSLGKYLFAFTAFWAYIAFSQYLLIWIANLPEEVPWYLVRTDSGWRGVGIFLALFQFVLPFVILIPRERKRRWGPLVFMSVWILVVHYVDVYWVVMPGISPAGPSPSWMDLAALAGIGGIAVAWVVSRLRGHAILPARDPYLSESLHYEPQQ